MRLFSARAIMLFKSGYGFLFCDHRGLAALAVAEAEGFHTLGASHAFALHSPAFERSRVAVASFCRTVRVELAASAFFFSKH